MLAAWSSVLTLSIVNELVPPHSLVAVALGRVVFDVILEFISHSVTRLAPLADVRAPAPANNRSFVPSKNSSKGAQKPAGFVAPLILASSDMAGVLFIVPLGDVNDMA